MANTKETPEVKEEVSLAARLWLGGADSSITLLNNIMTGGGLTFYFVTHFGLDASLGALVWVIFGIWNAVNDPIFGYISDRTKSKLGRRIPYIRYGGIAIAAVFALTWVQFFDPANQWSMFAQMLISLFFFDMLYTAVATSIYVMPYEMATTNETRSKIILVKVLFGFVSLAVPLFLLAQLEGILNSSVDEFRLLMTVIGVAAGAVIFISTFFMRERGNAQEEEQYPIVKSVVTCFKNKAFLAFESISFSVVYIQTGLMLGLSYYFEASGVPYIPCYAAMFVGILVGMWLWMKPGVGWGVKRCVVLMCLIFGGGDLVMLVFGNMVWAGVVGFFCSGIGFAGGMYLIPLMNGDVIDYDETVSGLRREGMYAGVNSLVTKPAISLANAAFPLMLGWFGYDQSLAIAEQTELAKFGVRFSWLIVVVVLLFVCALLIQKFYKLDGPEWDRTKAELAAKHAA